MFVKPLVLTLGLLYVANKFYLGRGILVENMMIVPRRESWNDHQDKERAAQFHSKKPNVKVGISCNNWSTSQQWFDQLVEAYEQLPEGNQRMDHHLNPFDQFLDITDKLINYSAKKSIDEHNHLILLYVWVFMFFLFTISNVINLFLAIFVQ